MALSSKRTKDKTQQALHDISHALLSAESLLELAKVVQEKLDPILNTKNFFLALYDKEDDTISFPYFADQRDQLVAVSAEESLTGHLIRGGIPLLLTGEEIEEMVHAGEVVVHGSIPKAFLGVPLKAKKETVGALVVQSYTDKMAYNKEDLQILNSISSQLGLFIEHKRVEQALRSSEKRLRSLYENVPSGIYQTTPSGKFISVNQALVRMFGYNSAEELLAADAHDLYLNIADRDHYRRELEKRGRISGIELVLKRKDGRPFTVLEHAYVIRDEKGNTLYYEGILTDISERVRMEQLQQALHRIAVAGHTGPSLLSLFNTAKEQLAPFLRWEDSFIALYSKETDTLSLLDVNDQFRAFPAGKSLTAYVVRKGESVLLSHEEIERMIHVGEIEATGATPQTWLGIPLRAETDIIGILVLRDYNNEAAFSEEDLKMLELIGRQIGLSIGYRKAQEALQNSEQRYHSIFVATIDGVLVFDLDGRIIEANPAACKMYGYASDEFVGLPAEKLVHPDYFHGFSNFKKNVEQNGRFLVDSVNLRKDGTQFDIELRGTRFSYHGQPHLLSIIIDTTERAKAQQALEDSKQKIERLYKVTLQLETSNAAQDVYDMTIEAAEKILSFSLASLDIVEEGKLIVKATSSELPSGASKETRLEQGGLAGETYRSGKTTIFGSMDEVPIAAPTRKQFSSGISAPIGDIGVFQVVSTTPDAFTEEDAHLLNLLLGHTYEAIKRISLQQQLEEQAIRDSLTGLYNRRYFTQVIEQEIARSKRYDHPIAFLIVDIDRFKEINDRFGHPIGDRVLQEIARLLEAQLRDVDIAIRYGGDEFLLVLPETTDSETDIVKERITKAIARRDKENKLIDFPVTVSIGAACWRPEGSEPMEEVLVRADRRMYVEKKSKRSEGFSQAILRSKRGHPERNLLDRKGDFAGSIALGRDITERKRAQERLENMLQGVIQALGRTTETRDPYTAGHQQRVTQLACAIAEEMKVSSKQLEAIRTASLIHDIGKIAIPAEILTKPTQLSEMELILIKHHPESAYDIVKEVDFLWPVADIILQHHERIDGSGYPQGLKGKEIRLGARILAVADVVEAMSSRRPYRPALGIDKALEEISKNKGRLYDPQVVDTCLNLFNKGFEFKTLPSD